MRAMRSLAPLLALTFFWPSAASAWVRTLSCYTDRPGSVFACREGEVPIPIAWPDACVGYWVQQDGSRDMGNLDSVRTIAERSFGHWSDVACANITFGELGVTPVRAVGVTAEGDPNGNLIMFVAEQWAYPAAVQALTTVTYRISDGVIVDADMEYNEQIFTIGVVDGSGDNAILDLENVMTHEAGHFLGLDHVVADENFVDDGGGVEAATMFATAGLGETIKRTLAADDMAGVCEIYPADRTCVCTFSPEEIRQSCTVEREPDRGCIASRLPSPGVLLSATVVALLLRRRRA